MHFLFSIDKDNKQNKIREGLFYFHKKKHNFFPFLIYCSQNNNKKERRKKVNTNININIEKEEERNIILLL